MSASVGTSRNILRSRRAKRVSYYIDYADKLRAFKVLDPACGSGAFLVEALEQLKDEYDKTNRTISELGGVKNQLSLLDLDRLVLRENLHGRDILPESVEISRLSIWLHTARLGERLEALDETIAVGDSLKSSDVGMYDVVIGNPPWGAELEGWTTNQLANRFPEAGGEKDSYAIFIVRAWELLKPGGILAFIVPNSWLTVNLYGGFREWLLRHFEIIEVTNVWKVFADVNHDASILVARKRTKPATESDLNGKMGETHFIVRAIERGRSESDKLKLLAAGEWWINHTTSHAFQYVQPEHRLEVIYLPKIAQELDRIAARCHRLDEVAQVTVGIQVYHHTRVSKEFIQRRGFHSRMREGPDWHPYVEANDVQRYYVAPSATQWLHFNDNLRDKRELAHYAQPRILVQQIFWLRLAAAFQKPSGPLLYLNTLFSIYEPQGVTLEAILGLLNSRFISGSYERRANRLFGDKFPKVSKLDLASVLVPKMSPELQRDIGQVAVGLQQSWQELRDALRSANDDLLVVNEKAALGQFGEFWLLSENEFTSRASERFGELTAEQRATVRDVYRQSKRAVDGVWHLICDGERKLEALVRDAYGVKESLYREIVSETPSPAIDWALRS